MRIVKVKLSGEDAAELAGELLEQHLCMAIMVPHSNIAELRIGMRPEQTDADVHLKVEPIRTAAFNRNVKVEVL